MTGQTIETATWEQGVAARTWEDVPRGYYAIPVLDPPDCGCSDDEDCEHDSTFIGYQLFERKAPRITRAGRRIGKDMFITGKVAVLPGVDPDRVRKAIEGERDWARGIWGPRGHELYLYDELARFSDMFREEYGRFTGRCGCCHRPLTEDASKLRGIGPECLKGRKA